jgi:hypothetical protein
VNQSIETTSNGPHSPIYILNDDALLNIFYLYQLDVQDEYEDRDGVHQVSWLCHRWRYDLAHVSRRWRFLILTPTSLLDLHLLCTYGVPVADMLAHTPPLPPIIVYYSGDREMTTKDEEGALLALSHRDRVRRTVLLMPASKLGRFIPAMDDQFPILEYLYLGNDVHNEESSLILPQTFQAPNLRYLNLRHTALPLASPILISTTGLVYLWLAGIP